MIRRDYERRRREVPLEFDTHRKRQSADRPHRYRTDRPKETAEWGQGQVLEEAFDRGHPSDARSIDQVNSPNKRRSV
jgi:hypothetical protein